MPETLTRSVIEKPRKMLAARLPEADRADGDIAHVVVRTLQVAGWSEKELAFRLGLADQSAVSRWCAGHENLSAFGRIWRVQDVRPSLLIAMAEQARIVGVVDVATVVTVCRTVRA